jgi:hypothetical protein
MTAEAFEPLPASDGDQLAAVLGGPAPAVFRGLAAPWPASVYWAISKQCSRGAQKNQRALVGDTANRPPPS